MIPCRQAGEEPSPLSRPERVTPIAATDPPAEVPMYPAILLGGVLALSQATPADDPPPAPAPAPAAERHLLMQSLQGTYPGWLLDGNRLRVSGWTEASFTGSTARRDQLPMGFDYRANDFLLQQNWLRVERPVDTSATTPTFGFRSDTILPGSDYRFTVARGLFAGQLTANDGTPNTYGFDPVQFYAEAYLPTVGRGLDVKAGRFFAQFGVESIDTTQTPFASRSYAFIYNPFTHTGLLSTLKLTDAWSVQNGLVAGSDVFLDPAAEPTYIGSAKWAPADGRDSVLFAVILGSGRFDRDRNFHNPQVFDLVWTHKLDARTTYTLECLYGFTTNVPGTGFANWLAAVHYLSRDLAPRLSGNVRLEFFEDFQGQRTGFEGLYSALTVGLNYKPAPCAMIRPEIRYDYNADSRPFEGRHGVFTAAMDVVFRW